MTEEQAKYEIIPIESVNAAAVFKPGGADPILKQVAAYVDQLPEFDMAKTKDREECASIAYKIRRSKTFLDDQGKQLADELRAKLDPINGERKKIRDELDLLAERVRAPLNDWEAARKRIDAFIEEVRGAPAGSVGKPSEVVADRIAEILADHRALEVDDEALREEVANIVGPVVEQMQTILEERKAIEAHQAEQERLAREKEEAERKAREAEIAREAEERGRREAAEQAEREARERAEAARQAKQRATTMLAEIRDLAIIGPKPSSATISGLISRLDQIERTDIPEDYISDKAEQVAHTRRILDQALADARQREADEAARQVVERARIQQENEEREREEQEQRRRAAHDHRQKIQNLATEGLKVSTGLSEQQAAKVIQAIASGDVPHVTINY